MRVAVAGVGCVSALGSSAEALVDGLLGSRVQAALLEGAHPSWPRWPVAAVPEPVAPVPGFDDDRKVHLLAVALDEARAGAGEVAGSRVGVFLGTGLSSVTPRELEESVYPFVGDAGVDRMEAMRSLGAGGVAPWRHLPERALAFAAGRLGATGAGMTSFSACAAGAEAIAAAARAIARGEVDVAYAGAHDSMLHPLGLLSFHTLGALSPARARPFDVRRDGFVLGEGAGVLRLEAAERCPEPLAWIVGAGSSCDAWRVTAPDPEGGGAELAMRRALADAGVSAGDVDWVFAHATATPLGDRAEARAIRRVLGEEVPVSSLKGAAGHTLAAAGAVQAVATVLGLARGERYGTPGFDEPDPEVGIHVQRHAVAATSRVVVSNSFGFGGQNCSLVFACA